MSEKDLLNPLIGEARSFSISTDQKDICNLLSKVSDAETWHACHFKLLNKLHCSLSKALDGRLNNRQGWHTNLMSELDELARQI